MGNYFWHVNKQRKALKWWNKSIMEDKRLNARPDLSRTYYKVGRRSLENQSKYTQLNGIDAKEYLNKARKLFLQMDLKYDFDELDRL